MSIADVEKRGEVIQPQDSRLWRELDPEPYECRVYLLREDDVFSAYVADLPGVASQGESEEAAIGNLIEAFRGAVEVYKSECGGIPWLTQPEQRPPEALERWILVNA